MRTMQSTFLLSTLLAGALTLSPTACSHAIILPRAVFDQPSYLIPCLETHAGSALANGTTTNSTIEFTFFDPNTNTSSHCSATFAPTSPPTTRRPSTSSRNGTLTASDKQYPFAWSVGSFVDVSNFTLSLQHSFRDDALGDPPWNVLTTFGGVNVTVDDPGASDGVNANYTCAQDDAEGLVCAIPDGAGPLLARIDSATG